MLSLIQDRPRLRNELSRRIGYTNGLHDIFRFSRVVRYLFDIGPSSTTALRNAILANENVAGSKYVDGVIEVSRALGLIHKSGTQFTLGDKGYALHAVEQLDSQVAVNNASLLNAVIESDGDATLNLLDLIANSDDNTSQGEELVKRLIAINDMRRQWAKTVIDHSIVREFVLRELSDSKRRLEQAIDPMQKRSQIWSSFNEERRLTSEQKVNRFFDHTVNPRRGWLKDLLCIRSQERTAYRLTNQGRSLLHAFKEAGCYKNAIIFLPVSSKVARILGIPVTEASEDIFWRATATYYNEQACVVNLQNADFIDLLEVVYPHLKLHIFNEATVESVYNAVSGILAVNGEYMTRDKFDETIDAVTREFPDRIYRLRARQDQNGYIALRK